ncbi:MAG: toast rack family protein [Candidatus Marinimicrobia bacterium]|jgi:hypothetical protein|nr:toast rack family protein [Candidatus Neomarinimicrobiota bacterium]MCK9484118.1 toast rack family protein [Candidatus Neomarinimicrobiota bacterium]MCK9560171.1 toast rack family protein [Candidatus Neomarinimicrobiota bacterium]MDD5062147.1 toast rack family protein [Candidatus Neomarinimicrobiota bacterium]MDD5230292.1 toast rack family protein [Candidatus Neomarinimicrobiota bacterium]
MKLRIIILSVLFGTLLWAENVRTERHNIPLKDEEELDVNIGFGLGELELRSHDVDGYLLRSEMTYSHSYYKPNVEYKTLGNRGRLRMFTEKFDKYTIVGDRERKISREDRDQNRWRLEFTRKIPIYYSIDLGLGEGRLDFTDLRVRDLKLQCGLSDVTVLFEKDNKEILRSLNVGTGLGNVDVKGLGFANIERFNVECGLGSTELVFNGGIQQDIRGKVEVGLGSVNIKVPDDIAVEVRSESSFLSSLNLHGFDRISNNLYRSGNWKSAKKRIYMDIEIGLGSVDISWLD